MSRTTAKRSIASYALEAITEAAHSPLMDLEQIDENVTRFLEKADYFLDTHAVPVTHRRFFILEWLKSRNESVAAALRLKSKEELHALFDNATYLQLLSWYRRVYGDLAFKVPFESRLGRAAKNHFFELSESHFDGLSVTISGGLNDRLKDEEEVTRIFESPSADALKLLRRIPHTAWTLAAASDYELSVSSVFSVRPAYHISMWHSHQSAEKLLKGGLSAIGYKDRDMAKQLGHHLVRASGALEREGFSLPAEAISCLKYLDRRCGTDVRYQEDYSGRSRSVLRDRVQKAHEKFLEFAVHAQPILVRALNLGESAGTSIYRAKESGKLSEIALQERSTFHGPAFGDHLQQNIYPRYRRFVAS